jgi:hypothetical protein
MASEASIREVALTFTLDQDGEIERHHVETPGIAV